MKNNFPNHNTKHAEEAIFSPSDYKNFLKDSNRLPNMQIPKAVIICYHRSLLNHIKENHATSSGDGIFERMLLLNETKNQIGVFGNFGIGAPSASVFLEELIAFGVEKFISIGTAGTLQTDIKIGDLIICDRAIRDEGTSHHYLASEKYSYPDKELTDQLIEEVEKYTNEFTVGTTWTTDAPYRETIAEVKKYQQEGVCTVEMEASALFAVSKYRNSKIASIITISDSLANLKWQPEFFSSKTNLGLETIFKIALNVLNK